MYTLLGASLLGFDLVRRTGGGAVAALLVEALGIGAEDLPLLARARPLGMLTAADRSEVSRATDTTRVAAVIAEVPHLVADGRVSQALSLVERAPLAGLPELLGLVRHDVFDWTWHADGDRVVQDSSAATAVAVVCDAVVAAYHVQHLRSGLAEQLVEPWATARHVLPRCTPHLGPCHDELDGLLKGLASLDGDGRARLQRATTEARAAGPWAPAMHSATWAVHLAGRVREAAVAQFRAVQVLAAETCGGLPCGETAGGVWNLVSGALQATVAADLLDDDTAQRLRAPLDRVLGPW